MEKQRATTADLALLIDAHGYCPQPYGTDRDWSLGLKSDPQHPIYTHNHHFTEPDFPLIVGTLGEAHVLDLQWKIWFRAIGKSADNQI